MLGVVKGGETAGVGGDFCADVVANEVVEFVAVGLVVVFDEAELH